MAHIREVMAMGVASPLARMLGSNRQMTVTAGGSSQEDATPLIVNYALIQSPIVGGGVRLGAAAGAAVTALYNSGPAPVNLYPAEDDAFDDQAPNLPLALAAGQSALAVPSIDRWIVSLQGAGSGGGIAEAPSDGNWYGRRNAAWSPVLGLGGGTLSGPLILAGDPATALGGATKGYVDNTAALLAPLATPAFTGAPTAPTPPAADNSVRLATTAYVQAQGYLAAVALAGDIAGSGASPLAATVVGLQGRALAATAPANGQVLAWSAANNNWAPSPAPPAAAGGSTGQLQWNSGGSLAGLTMAGDATLDTASGNLALVAVNPNIGTFQGLTIDGKGRITAAVNMNYAPLASPALTGAPTAPTPATANNSTALATTAFVKAQGYLAGNQTITLSGDASGSGTTAIPVTLAAVNGNVGAFQGLTLDAKGRVTAAVNLNYAPLASPAFSGAPTAPTPATGDNSTALATTAFVKAQNYLTAPVSLTAQVSGILGLPNGGTGAAAPAAALANLGGVPLAGGTMTGTLNVNANSGGSIPGDNVGGLLALQGADGFNTAAVVTAYENGTNIIPRFAMRLAGGTRAAMAAIGAAQTIGQINFQAWDGAAWSPGGQVQMTTAESWSSTARGTYLDFVTTAVGTTAGTIRMRINNDGGLAVPHTVVGGSQGPGTVNVSAGYYVGGVNVTPGQGAASQNVGPVNPAGTASTTYVMMGVGAAITPKFSGRVVIIASGVVQNNTAGDGGIVQIFYGTGTAPANGAAQTGSAAGNFLNMALAATGDKPGFCTHALVTGLALGTAYWLDLAARASPAGTCTLANVSVTAFEI